MTTPEMFATALIFALILCATRGQIQLMCPTANVCFAIDESGSISSSQFIQQTNAIVAITNDLESRAPGSSFSAAGFSSVASTIQTLTTSTNFIQAIQSNTQSRGSTSSGSGLQRCDLLLSGASDPRLIVLITDEQDNTAPSGVSVDDAIKASGITIATIGVGSGVSSADLQSIASQPDFFIPVNDFDQLGAQVIQIVDDLCVALATPTPTSSPVPSSTPTGSPTPSITPTLSVTPSITPTPSVTPSTTPTPSATPSPLPPRCVNVDCAKCGQVLECYVNSGFSGRDQEICEVVTNASIFCSDRRGRGTLCNQQCSGMQGVQCFPGASFRTCPAVIGSIGGTARCMGGAARGLPADLSNFASYRICDEDDVTCLGKCEAGVCPCLGTLPA